MTGDTVRYEIDGSAISSAADFYAEIGRAVNGPGGYFGSNLDALADCLRGGFGTPESGDFEFVWRDSATTRAQLGVSAADEPPMIDRVVEVFSDVGVPLTLS
ncbi:barstar family protein [Williamsia phyllosphaerae]|uniref:Barstar (barnase inhibitor) domain-containing protein n=1 Tax=Williamsia phyllosphaerae TaxID=885042 RepID=A0ABQ1UD28_9NOCA|nr:barstar family protein [Williamsia phyllosphaerae]GGF15894.1 hypothetical protein GCM10007298_09900 [Williamsia phyllosphaerae]